MNSSYRKWIMQKDDLALLINMLVNKYTAEKQYTRKQPLFPQTSADYSEKHIFINNYNLRQISVNDIL